MKKQAQIERKFLRCECCNFLAVIPQRDKHENLICPFCNKAECGHGGKFIEIDKEVFLREVDVTMNFT